MLLAIYIIVTYILFMCLFRADINQCEHLVVVGLFCVLLVALTTLESKIINMQQVIDSVLFTDTHHTNPLLIGCLSTFWTWIKKDYESSQLRRGIRRTKRHVRDKYFLLYSKINDIHKA